MTRETDEQRPALEQWLESRGRSGHDSVRFIARLVGFIVGNQSVAESFRRVDTESVPEWLQANAEDPGVLEFARRVAGASKEASQAAVATLQEKASGLQNLMVVVVPGALAATGAMLSHLHGVSGALAFLLLAAGDVALIVALVQTLLAGGLVQTLELNLARLDSEKLPLPSGTNSSVLLRELNLREVHAMHNSAWLAMHTSHWLALDLHAARRAALIGAFSLGLGLMLALVA